MTKLSKEHVLKLAQLSRLQLTDDEIQQYQEELSSILEYVEILEDVDVKGLLPTYQVTGLQNVTREDIVAKQKASPETLLNCAPKTKDNYIQVGRMI